MTALSLAPTTPPQILYFDILFLLFSHIRNRRTLLALMRTCWQLYNAGIPWLLRLRYQVTSEKLPIFYAFLLADPSFRFAAIRDLHIPGQISDGQVEIIADIIRRAVDLEALHVDASSLHLRDIAIALESLRKLEELRLDGPCRVKAQHVLNRLRCPLRRIHVHCLEIKDPTFRLHRFKATLEQFVGGHSAPTRDDTYFSKIVSFSSTTLPKYQMSSLMAFPNLRILIVKSPYRAFKHRMEDLPSLVQIQYTVRRLLNLLDQGGERWDSLVYHDTDMVGLYILSLHCHVDYLVIHNINVAGVRSFE